MSSIDLPVLPIQPPPTPPSSLLVRYGRMKLVGEFSYDGPERLSCGSQVVIRTRRGTELASVLGTTCAGADCPVIVPREKVQEYIGLSGGAEYPFSGDGRILRLATKQDIEEQARLDGERAQYISACKALIKEMEMPMKLVDVERILGAEMTTFFFMSEHRVDFRGMVKQLAARFHTRIQMHQVGARDEARLVADFETCGQYCCCKRFLKVLKPVNMGSAKMQKATLDPNKISGRCGRLKCCLRYEDAAYEELRKRLPRVGTQVRTADGVGFVIETTILTQLVKVRLEGDRIIAVANDELLERDIKADAAAARPAAMAATPSPAPSPVAAASPAPPPGAQRGGRGRRQKGGRGQGQPQATPSSSAAGISSSMPPATRPALTGDNSAAGGNAPDSVDGPSPQGGNSGSATGPSGGNQAPGKTPPPAGSEGAGSTGGMGTLGRRRRRGRSRGRGPDA